MNGVKERLSLMTGVSASLVWGLSPAFVRILGENLGIFTTGMIISLTGGCFALVYKGIRGELHNLKIVDKRYWIICGGSFVIFGITSQLAVGLAVTRAEVLSTGIFRLLWPLMTLLTMIPICRAKVNKQFPFAVALCFFGILISHLDVYNPSLGHLISQIMASWKPCLVGLISSLCWGIYSNYYSQFIHNSNEDFVGILMLVTGIIQLIFSMLVDPIPTLYFEQIQQLSLLVIFSFLANIWWNIGMRGEYSLYVVLFANFIPVISTLFTGLILGVDMTVMLLLGNFLIVISTIWSKKCFI